MLIACSSTSLFRNFSRTPGIQQVVTSLVDVVFRDFLEVSGDFAFLVKGTSLRLSDLTVS